MILSGGRTTVVYGASRLSLDNLHILQENGKCHNFTGNLECMLVDQYYYLYPVPILVFVSSSNISICIQFQY